MPSTTNHDRDLERNQLLRALGAREYERVRLHLTRVTLRNGDIIARAGERIRHVYFPRTAVFSMISIMEDGSAAEVGTIGDEGCVGVPAFLGVNATPTQCIAQMAGDAWRIGVGPFRNVIAENDGLNALLRRYTQAFLNQVSQSVACNRLHPIVERCARWLLMTHDRTAGMDDFVLKQEHLSYMLGVRREGVSAAAGALQRAGLIRYRRGRITVTDRAGLEAAACECYEVVRSEHARLLG